MKTLFTALILISTLTACETISSKLQQIQSIITEEKRIPDPSPEKLPINQGTLEQRIFIT